MSPVTFGIACIIVAVAVCVVLWLRRSSLGWWTLPIGALLSATYLYNIQSAQTVYYGLVSDQSFQTAYTATIMRGHLLGDCYDWQLAAHYPPLFFWVSGLVACLVGWSPIQH